MPTTIGADLILGGDQSWMNDGQLTVNGQTITGAGRNLTIDGSVRPPSPRRFRPHGSVIKAGSGVLC
jgi:hypothetical protein